MADFDRFAYNFRGKKNCSLKWSDQFIIRMLLATVGHPTFNRIEENGDEPGIEYSQGCRD
jgi:hypothetical protein